MTKLDLILYAALIVLGGWLVSVKAQSTAEESARSYGLPNHYDIQNQD